MCNLWRHVRIGEEQTTDFSRLERDGCYRVMEQASKSVVIYIKGEKLDEIILLHYQLSSTKQASFII